MLFSVAVLLAGGATAVRGQSALDGFDPNANGTVNVVVVQPDGKILIGGSFTTVLGVARNRIARLNPDGTLDTAFNPNAQTASAVVYSIAVQADGKILVGGNFTSIGGQARLNIARLDAVTGMADSFNPFPNGSVYAIVVQADGKILVGGLFNGANPIGGQTRNFIARLDPTTGLADSFNPNANASVRSIALQADGKILVGGSFGDNCFPGPCTITIGGQERHHIARLDATTGLADSWNPDANASVGSIVVQADGKILASGGFTSIGGQARSRIARLDATTGLADSFNPNPSGGTFGFVYSIAVQPDGRVLVGGAFASIGGQARNRLARLDSATGLADSFDPNTNSDVNSIAVQADGKILAGGDFSTLTPNGGAAVTRNNIARLETDGRLDRTLNLGIAGGFVFATAVQPDGKILIGGGFTTVLGVARSNIARLNTDGTLDTTFSPNADSDVYAIAVQADGKILAGGFFFNIGGQPRNLIARLNPDGTADSWNPNSNNQVDAIVVQADGKILVGGNFTNIGGQPRNYIARLDPVTGFADSWNPNSNGSVYSIAVQADGKILASGPFFSIGGQTRNHIARLDATTGAADSFDPNPPADFNAYVSSIAVQPDGKILACGGFITIGGQTRNHIARLDPTTGLADSWDPNAGTSAFVYTIALQADGKVLAVGSFGTIGGQLRNDIARLDGTTGMADSFNPNADFTVFSVAVQADGKILAGGQFSNIGGQPRTLFARLSDDTAALQNLAATPTTVTWTRGGSSPQFARVTFESSTDNVIYTPLGNGIPQSGSSNWTLTGLSFPTNQNFYIRARGYYRSGRYADGSIQESVRNAIFVPPTITSANNTTFTVGAAGTFRVTTTGIPTGTSMVITKSGALPGGVTFVDNNNGTATLAGTPGAGAGGSYPITITASNGVSPNATQSFTLAVNEAPRISSANSTTFTVGSAGTFNVTTDRGFPTPMLSETGSLPGGVTFIDNGNGTATLAGNPVAGSGGIYALTITANNGVSPNANQSFTLTVNEAPIITSANNATFIAGSAGTFAVTTAHSFPANPALSKTGALPGGVTFTDNANGTATIAGTPVAGSGGSYSLTITANNGVSPNGTQSFTLTVNEAPRISSGIGTTFTVGSAGTFSVTTDRGFPTPALSQTGTLPGGVTFTNNGNGTATIAGTPAVGSGGSYSLTITANNGVSPNATQSFTLTVNEPPRISSANGATFTAGSAGTFNVTTDRGFPAPALSRTGALPGGVTFTDNANGTATIAGTPVAGSGGSYSLTITANNGVSPNGTQSFTLTVNEAPVITSANNATFIAGSARTFTVTTSPSFPANPALSKTGALPGGVTFTDNANGTATLAGTPAAGSGGTYPLTITANNGVSPNGTQTFTLTVNEAQIVSRKLHNGVPFDINLPLAGTGIECRSGGASNNYQVVFTFTSAVTFNSATVSAGTGIVSGSSGSGTTIVTVNLTGVTNVQRITVTLFGVNNGGDLPVRMGVLVGDTTGDGSVNTSDIGQTKANSGQVVDAFNFRTDVNVSGSINASDVGLVKSKAGTTLPAEIWEKGGHSSERRGR